MPFAGFDDFDDCLSTMRSEQDYDEETARRVCGALQAEQKSEHGDVDALREAITRGRGLIADVGVDLVSGVDVPAIDSTWVMRKSTDETHDYRVDSQLVLSKRDDDAEADRVAYAAAMIPREPDKEGDVVATPTVEKAAHDFLTSDGGVDTDHSLIDGEGDVVESWVLKADREFDLPGGETREYGAGTWMVGIKWGKNAWERIEAGELTGLSIYGMAEQVELGKAADACVACGAATDTDTDSAPTATATAKDFAVPFADEVVVHVVYESQTAAEKASEAMGLGGDIHEHELDGMAVFMPGESHDEFVDAYLEFAESDDVGPVVDSYHEKSRRDVWKDEEDPCWDGYTMVGLDENGDPRCVPDDEIDNVEFDSVTVRESPDQPAPGVAEKGDDAGGDGGETPNNSGGETSKHEAMTDDDPSLSAVAEKVDGLSDDVSAIKDAIGSADSTEKAAIDAIDDAVQSLAESEDIDLAADDMRSMLIDAIQPADKAEDGMDGDDMDEMDDEDDDDDEDMEMSASEKSVDDANLAKGHTGGPGTTAGLDDDGSTSGVPSYRDLVESHGDN